MPTEYKNKKLAIFIIILIIAFPLLYIIQGIDFTDTGFALTNYQQIFNDPSSVSYWFHLWLTNIIGGIWNCFFGWGGLLSFKIAAVLVSWSIAALVYIIYKNIFKNRLLLLTALLFGLCFHYSGRITVIYYNNISMLLLAAAAVFLLKGIDNRSRLLLFCSGLFLSLSAFARLPNILSLSFILVILSDTVIEKKKPSFFFINCIIVFAGFITASVFVLITMAVLGHLDIYLNSIKELFINPSTSNYTLARIIKRFCTDWTKAIIYGIILLVTGIFFIFLEKRLNRILFVILSAAFALALFLFIWITRPTINYFILISIGVIFVTCIIVLTLAGNEHKRQKKLVLPVILLVSVLSVGSDTGMTVGSYGIIFGLPLVFWFLSETPPALIDIKTRMENEERMFVFSLNYFNKQKIITFLVLFYIITGIPFALRYVYRDNSQRSRMNVQVNNNMLKGIYTTSERAYAIKSLVSELNRYVEQNDYLLTYDAVSMIYFLTKTRPYLYNSWPSLYSPFEFQNAMNKAQYEHEYLPVVVLAKVLIRNNLWPDSEINLFDKPNSENRIILFNFLEENNYHAVWENTAFKILLPFQNTIKNETPQ